MKLTIKFERKTIFGDRAFTEDSTYYSQESFAKCFAALKKNYDTALEIANAGKAVTIFWDSITDYNNGIITIRHYTALNSYDIIKIACTKAKQKINALLDEIAA